jgi:hypothetical protein
MKLSADPDEHGPVTVIFKRRARPGREAEFEAWVAGVTREAMQFPGHRGADIIRPAGRARPEYAIIFRFESYTDAQRWEASEARARWVERVRPLTEGEAEIQRVSGLEFWFTPPAGAAPAPRWKMAVVTFLALWPLNVLVNLALAPVSGGWPIPLRALVVVGLLVPVMTYAVMPLATRLFAAWLYPAVGP